MKGIVTVRHRSPLPIITECMKLYQDLMIPLNRFIEVSVDGNFNALIIEGEPTKEELTSAWELITELYVEQIGDDEQKLSISLYREIIKLQVTVWQIKFLVHTLKSTYVKEFAEELNRILHTKLKFDVRFKDDYDTNLGRAIKRSKEYVLRLDLKTKQFEALQKSISDKSQGFKPTREYYETILINLSDFAKYGITDQISTYQFVSRIKSLNKYLETKQ
jgi:hypothetical protein